MKKDNLRLIVLDSAKELGDKVNKHLTRMNSNYTNLIVPTKESWFADGHEKVELLETVRDKDVFILTDIGNFSNTYKIHGYINHTSPNDLAMQLKDTIGACNCHARSLSVIMPLLYAGRQHRRISREALSCSAYLRELDDDPNIKRFITFDAHDEGVQQAMRYTEFDNFYATNVLLEKFINEATIEELRNVLFVAPDNGAAGRRDFFLNAFNSTEIKKDAGSFYKKRDYNVIIDGKSPIIEHSYSGNEEIAGKTAIIIDDMISSGSSMFDVIEELRKRKVGHIYLISTYALFVNGIDKLREYHDIGYLDGVYTTNLSYIEQDFRKENWLHIVDCSDYLAQIINNIHRGDSISDLLRDKSYPGKILTKKFKQNNK